METGQALILGEHPLNRPFGIRLLAASAVAWGGGDSAPLVLHSLDNEDVASGILGLLLLLFPLSLDDLWLGIGFWLPVLGTVIS